MTGVLLPWYGGSILVILGDLGSQENPACWVKDDQQHLSLPGLTCLPRILEATGGVGHTEIKNLRALPEFPAHSDFHILGPGGRRASFWDYSGPPRGGKRKQVAGDCQPENPLPLRELDLYFYHSRNGSRTIPVAYSELFKSCIRTQRPTRCRFIMNIPGQPFLFCTGKNEILLSIANCLGGGKM